MLQQHEFQLTDTPDTVDVVVLTALPVEYQGMVNALGPGQERDWNALSTYEADVADQRVRVVPIGAMGNVHAAQTAQRVIDVWNPARLLLVGIAGGIPAGAEDLRLGDILVPDQVVGYELGKLRSGTTDPRWNVHRPNAELLEAARGVRALDWIPSIVAGRPDGSATRINPVVHFGPVLSGDKVIVDPVAVAALHASWPKAIGVEMEAVGVGTAVYRNRPAFLVIKAVVDTADENKNDDWHRYAAEAAGRFAVAVLHRAPKIRPSRRPQSMPATAPTRFSGRVKLHVIKRLARDWEDVADYFDVKPWTKACFTPGNEPRELWELLELWGKLFALPDAFDEIGRGDLGDYMREHGN
jgi:nucleoside phosphorylase